MKKEDFINILSERTGIQSEKIIEYINSENEELEELEVPNVNLFTDEELTARLKNHVDISKPTIIEMAIKERRNDLKEKYGVDFEGKNLDNLVNAAIEAGEKLGLKKGEGKPNEQIDEKNKIIEKLQKNLMDIEAQKEDAVSSLKSRIDQMEINTYLNSLIPDNLDTSLSKKDLGVLFSSDVNSKKENGKVLFFKNGEILRDDKTQDALSGEQVMINWLSNKGIKQKESKSGRGEINEPGKIKKTKLSGIETTDDFRKYCKENNIPANEQIKVLKEIREEKPDFYLT